MENTEIRVTNDKGQVQYLSAYLVNKPGYIAHHGWKVDDVIIDEVVAPVKSDLKEFEESKLPFKPIKRKTKN